jgi:hypothetical protein
MEEVISRSKWKSLKLQQAFGKEKALLLSFIHKLVNYLEGIA